MKTTTIFAAITAMALSFVGGTASADNFDNTVASVTAEFDRYDVTIEGTENGGYTELSFGADVMSYDITDSITGELAVSATRYQADDTYGLGMDYTATYYAGAFRAWGVAEVEYIAPADDFSEGDFYATPRIGAGYDVTATTSVWSEVGYTRNASNDWDTVGGVAELGVDFHVAENITLTPSVVQTFDTSDDEAQLNLSVVMSF